MCLSVDQLTLLGDFVEGRLRNMVEVKFWMILVTSMCSSLEFKTTSPPKLETVVQSLTYVDLSLLQETSIIFTVSQRVFSWFQVVTEKLEEALTYNVTACCVDVDLSDICLPLCSYDANMTDIKALAGICGQEFHKLLRCGAGGRNHGACCSRRGVPPACLSICSGVMTDSLLVTATTCIPFIGNIALCFEEGNWNGALNCVNV